MPPSNNKLFATWNGPFKLVKACENDNYVIWINRRQVKMHINSLRKYNFPAADSDGVNMMVVSAF